MDFFLLELAGITLKEWIGYAASLFILIGMTMSSVRKLRWINLAGNILFTLYGLLIASLPVTLMNALIGMVNSWFLIRLYQRRESFRLLPVTHDNQYLKAFIEFHKSDIKTFFPAFVFNPPVHDKAFIVLRDMTVAAVIVGTSGDQGHLHIELDYAVAAYRDLKPGHFAYASPSGGLAGEGYRELTSVPGSPKHQSYLLRCGFAPGKEKNVWSKRLG